MPWTEKYMMIVLADAARMSLPLCGVIKEVIKGNKIECGDAYRKQPEKFHWNLCRF